MRLTLVPVEWLGIQGLLEDREGEGGTCWLVKRVWSVIELY